MAFQQKPDVFSEELEEKRKKFLGDFKTGMPCINDCPGHIVDHATECSPVRHDLHHDEKYGPGPSSFERLNNFHVCHKYSCDYCGIIYDNQVIEGRREYVPRERREK
jgi:hypothetical protein